MINKPINYAITINFIKNMTQSQIPLLNYDPVNTLIIKIRHL